MSFAVDANILVYASDRSSPVHTRGNLVPDTHLAALLRQHGVATLYTRDRDFRRFDFLSVIDPLEDAVRDRPVRKRAKRRVIRAA